MCMVVLMKLWFFMGKSRSFFYLQNLILEISRKSGSSGSRFWDFSYYLKSAGSHKSSNSWPSINRDFFPEDLVHKKCNLLIFFLIFLENKTGGASRRIQSKITKWRQFIWMGSGNIWTTWNTLSRWLFQGKCQMSLNQDSVKDKHRKSFYFDFSIQGFI